MKKRILYTFIVMFIGCVANTKVAAQTFGVEQNTDGSYTFTFADGGSITTTADGHYTSTGVGSCSGCSQMLPVVEVYGYKKSTSTPTVPDYQYTSYRYNDQYYNLPTGGFSGPAPTYPAGTGIPPQPVISTAPTPQPPSPAVSDPCKGNVPTTLSIANVNAPAYAGAMDALTQTFNYSLVENSMFLGVNPANGTYSATAIKPGGIGGADGNPSFPNFVPLASAHTHPTDGYPMPSVGDIYSLATYNAQYPSYQAAYVISQSDGSTTALVVTSHDKLMKFLATYPDANYRSGADWTPGTELANACNSVVANLDSSPPVIGSPTNEAAWLAGQAYVLDKFDTGLAIVKKNTDGTFSQVHFVKTTDAQGNVSYNKYNCN